MQGAETVRQLRLLSWGLVPPWAKDLTMGNRMINARSETLFEKRTFAGPARTRRCLVPADGWYEWQVSPTALDAKGKPRKQPFFIARQDGSPLFMAGLWSSWRPKDAPKDAPPLLSCTIITTDAAGPLAEIHDRMPLTISAEDWDHWLDPDAPIDEGLLRGHGDLDRIAIREVSRLVNSVRNNGPELIEPAQPQAEQGTLL